MLIPSVLNRVASMAMGEADLRERLAQYERKEKAGKGEAKAEGVKQQEAEDVKGKAKEATGRVMQRMEELHQLTRSAQRALRLAESEADEGDGESEMDDAHSSDELLE